VGHLLVGHVAVSLHYVDHLFCNALEAGGLLVGAVLTCVAVVVVARVGHEQGGAAGLVNHI